MKKSASPITSTIAKDKSRILDVDGSLFSSDEDHHPKTTKLASNEHSRTSDLPLKKKKRQFRVLSLSSDEGENDGKPTKKSWLDTRDDSHAVQKFNKLSNSSTSSLEKPTLVNNSNNKEKNFHLSIINSLHTNHVTTSSSAINLQNKEKNVRSVKIDDDVPINVIQGEDFYNAMHDCDTSFDINDTDQNQSTSTYLTSPTQLSESNDSKILRNHSGTVRHSPPVTQGIFQEVKGEEKNNENNAIGNVMVLPTVYKNTLDKSDKVKKPAAKDRVLGLLNFWNDFIKKD